MKKTALYFFLSSFLISACSIYSSEGRRMFEERSQNTPRSTASTGGAESANGLSAQESADSKEHGLNCWSQPARDPLWRVLPKESYSVKVIKGLGTDNPHGTRIEVCVEVIHEPHS